GQSRSQTVHRTARAIDFTRTISFGIPAFAPKQTPTCAACAWAEQSAFRPYGMFCLWQADAAAQHALWPRAAYLHDSWLFDRRFQHGRSDQPIAGNDAHMAAKVPIVLQSTGRFFAQHW